jgi:CTP:phosphocholine cytidylyltransferase-like protein
LKVAWYEVSNVSTSQDILNEFIFSNEQIKQKNKPIIFNSWIKSNIRQITDIWNEKENNWITSKKLLEKLMTKNNWMTQYLSIKNAIPKDWVRQLMGEQARPQSNRILKLDEQGKITVKGKPLGKNTSRNIKSILQKNYARLKLEQSLWENNGRIYGKTLKTPTVKIRFLQKPGPFRKQA